MTATSQRTRRPLVAANWKMHGNRELTTLLIATLGALENIQGVPLGLAGSSWRSRILRKARRTARTANRPAAGPVDVMVCPPFVYLSQASTCISTLYRSYDETSSEADPRFFLGAQNLGAETEGAFTGEVSAEMLRDVGCTHVIIGHSERRTLYNESDDVVATKLNAACKADLKPLLCIGESQSERTAGRTEKVLAQQLKTLAGLPSEAPPPIIAYEPVWAIGTGDSASPQQAQQAHAFIRAELASSGMPSNEVRILYGGSVKPDNAAELFAEPDVDGALVGGASLNPHDFLTICNLARKHHD